MTNRSKEADRVMRQEAPYPFALDEIIETWRYRPGWGFRLADVDRGQGSRGLTVVVHIDVPDAYDHDRSRGVIHYMPVPPASYDRETWRRWLFDQCILIDLHEGMEYAFDGNDHPFSPQHGPGRDPYTVPMYVDEIRARTSFRGEVKS